MPKTWKQISGALGAMVIGSLVTSFALTAPEAFRNDPGAQEPVYDSQTSASKGLARRQVQDQNLAAAQNLSTAFRNVANLLRPSVVSINTTQTQVIRGRRVPPELEGMLGIPSIPPQRREANGTGSGVIVRSDGYILTNNHVVEGADELEVEFADGSKIEGKIIGTDPQTDLAVIKVERDNLEAVPMGSSEAIQVGDWVVAIGSPFGLEQTVTAGIISGKNRIRGIVGDGRGFEDFLQTDAAINPGNSGGPLVNLRGELVGINTAIMSRSGSSAGIGFAIPVSLAAPVFNSIIEYGEVRRGFLGATLAEVNDQTKQRFDIRTEQGVVIESVLEGMPADAAGIQPGDVVTAIDGRPMKLSARMRNYVASRPPGAQMVIELNRRGKAMQVQVDLKERTPEVMAQFGSGEVLGAKLVPVTPETAKKYGYPNLKSGLIVTGIKDGSAVGEDGLLVGDVIEAVQTETGQGFRISSAKQLQAILEEAARQEVPVRLIIRRGDEQMLMVVSQ
jgi:serine protease Do